MNKYRTKKHISSHLRKIYPILILGFAIVLSGCASMRDSILLGAGTLGAVGAGAGAAAGENVGGALIGLGVGAVLGGTMGFLAHKDEEQKKELVKIASRKGKDFGKDLPTLKAPKASCTRVGEKIDGDSFIGAHILCSIERPAVWSSK